jgi:peptidoglycan L-alanyl-D-glutamate endopeptidase CwlK
MSEIDRSLEALHPVMLLPVQRLLDELVRINNPLRIFEGWRSPERQARLFRDARKVTRAKPWLSAHQYGLAVDFVLPLGKGYGWTWNVPPAHWQQLREAAVSVGLVVPSPGWDPGHVQHPFWDEVRNLTMDRLSL